mgnify:CR=1 FL=1
MFTFKLIIQTAIDKSNFFSKFSIGPIGEGYKPLGEILFAR